MVGKRKRRSSGPCIGCLLLAAVLLAGCGFRPAVGISMQALRCTDDEADAVGLSFWLYDEDGRLVGNTFTSGGLDPRSQGTEWKFLDDADAIRIPSRLLDEDGLFRYQVKLNPHRLVTPPDAVFDGKVEPDAVRGSDSARETVVLRASDGSPFELRISYCIWDESCR